MSGRGAGRPQASAGAAWASGRGAPWSGPSRIGEGAQGGFSYAGRVPRGRGEPLAKSWTFVMTLSDIRHQCAEAIHDEAVRTSPCTVRP